MSVRGWAVAICLAVGASGAEPVDFSTYRGFRFGSTTSAAAQVAGTKLADVRILHERPAVISEFDWQPATFSKTDAAKFGSVREGVLRFYNGELFQIIVTYDRQRLRE